MDLINIAGLKSHLSEVIGRVSETGKPVIIGRYGVPVAKIVPIEQPSAERVVGFGKHLSMAKPEIIQQQESEPLDEDTLNGFYS